MFLCCTLTLIRNARGDIPISALLTAKVDILTVYIQVQPISFGKIYIAHRIFDHLILDDPVTVSTRRWLQ